MRYVKNTITLVGAVAIVAAVAGAAVMLVRRKQQSLAEAPKFAAGPAPVHVTRARSGDFTQSQAYLAVVEPLQTADVSARVTAEVLSISCDEGDVVHAGDVMAVLDSREIRAGIAAAEAQIQEAQDDLQASRVLLDTLAASVEYWRRELARDQSLRSANNAAISLVELEATAEKLQLKQGDLDSARHRLNAIQHKVEAAQDQKRALETRLAYCSVVSPFEGVVTRRLVDAGDLAAPGKALFRIEDRGTVRLAFDVPQDDLVDIKPGLQVLFTAGGRTFRAKLSRIYPSLNAVRMARAEVDVAGVAAEGLTPGSYLTLQLVTKDFPEAVIIPASALVGVDDEPAQVYVVQQDQLTLRPVQVNGRKENELAVAGVVSGETVVVHTFLGWARYHDGQKVEVIE